MPEYPLHFMHEDGSPFYFMGDTQWELTKAIPSENLNWRTMLHYIDTRAAQGFTYVHCKIGDEPNIGPINEGGHMWRGAQGVQANPAHFQEADFRIQYLNSKGLTLGLMLAWSQGWKSFASDEARLRYARYITARYSAYNVVFIVSGEYDEEKVDYAAIAQEIRSTDPHQRLIAIYGTGSVRSFATASWMSFGDYMQIYTSLHQNMLRAMDRAKPVVNAEYGYYLRDQNGDGVVDKPNSASLSEIRHATWDIAMAGGGFVTGFGTTYYGGVRDPGPFDVDAPKNDDWEEDVQWIKKFFTGHEWWKLVPADSSMTGKGTKYVLREISRQYLAYVRDGGGGVRLNLGAAGHRTYRMRRFDPRSGAYTDLPDYTGVGPISLPVPDAQDWAFSIVAKSE